MDMRTNTLARYKLLNKALRGTKQLPASLLIACRSQGGLAQLSIPAEGIEPMALNTLKAKANEFIENGGWLELDKLRKNFIQSKRNGPLSQSSRSTTKCALKAKIIELKESINTERHYRIRLQVSYDALLSRMRILAKDDSDISDFINRHVMGFSFKRLTVAGKENLE